MDRQDVQASFGRCCLNPKFMDTFYKNFMATSPDVAALFRQANFTR